MKPHTVYFGLLNALLFLTGLSYITTWLPFIRGIMDGPTYTWGITFFGRFFSGSGTGGDFYFVVINAVWGLLLMTSFFWFRQRRLFYLLMVVWHGSMISNALYEVFFGAGYTFEGDTLGVSVNLSYVIVPYMILLGVLVSLVLSRDSAHPFRAVWTRRNRNWLLALTLPLPIQYILLSTGEPHGLTDQIGVVIALLQVFLVSRPLRGYLVEG